MEQRVLCTCQLELAATIFGRSTQQGRSGSRARYLDFAILAAFQSLKPGSSMPTIVLNEWMNPSNPISGNNQVVVLQERKNTRKAVQSAIDETVRDHFAGLEILSRIGRFETAREFIRNKLPPGKRARSGDFGELMASEYIDQLTDYSVPIKKLRWKDDRATTMRGNDVIGIRPYKKKWRILKAESKSRAALSSSAVNEAIEGLNQHSGRPNPSSLAFIAHRLRELGRDDEAEAFEDLQSRTPKLDEVEQMVFTLSGNDPTTHLKDGHAKVASMTRHFVGCVISDHQVFINEMFDRLYE